MKGAVLLVANFPPGTGYAWWLMEHFWWMIGTEMRRQGRQCLLAYPTLDGDVPNTLRNTGVELIELDFDDRSISGVRRLSRIIRSHDVKALYLTDRSFLDWRYAWVRTRGVHRIVVHDHTPGDRPPVGGFRGQLKATAMAMPGCTADQYVAVTEFVRQRMILNARLPARKCCVVPNGISARGCQLADRKWARDELGVQNDDVVIAMVGRAHRYKNIGFAIECARRLRDEHPENPMKFVFIGAGPHLGQLEGKVQSASLHERFLFLGGRSDVRRLLCGCDVGLHCSLGEVGYSLSVLEFMDAGLPTVVPDRPSVCGSIKDGVTGLIYQSETLEAACKVLLALATDAQQRRSMGLAAQADRVARFSLELTTREFEEKVISFL